MSISADITWSAAVEAVEAAGSVLVVTHVSPDGDAIGSLLGLAAALRERGKAVTTAVDGGVPDGLRYLAGADEVIGKLRHGRWDLMVSVDASDEERTGIAGAFGRARSGRVINLDHHVTNTGFGDVHLVVPGAVSATEIIYDWLFWFPHPLSQPVATALLTGLVTDTLGFRTSNVTARTLAVAQGLVEAGASLHDIMTRVLINTPYNTISLWKQVFSSVELRDGLISGLITQADLRTAGFHEVTDGGLVGLLATVNEAAVAVVFKETETGRIEISLRCKPGFDVGQTALSLGGGGHKQASGATIDGPLEAACARVIPLLEAVIAQGQREAETRGTSG